MSMEAIVDAINTQLGAFDAQDALSIERAFGELGEVYQALGNGVTAFSERIAEGPIDASVSQHLADLGATTSHGADVARETAQVLNSAHPELMDRLHDPKPGDAATFDVAAQQG